MLQKASHIFCVRGIAFRARKIKVNTHVPMLNLSSRHGDLVRVEAEFLLASGPDGDERSALLPEKEPSVPNE